MAQESDSVIPRRWRPAIAMVAVAAAAIAFRSSQARAVLDDLAFVAWANTPSTPSKAAPASADEGEWEYEYESDDADSSGSDAATAEEATSDDEGSGEEEEASAEDGEASGDEEYADGEEAGDDESADEEDDSSSEAGPAARGSGSTASKRRAAPRIARRLMRFTASANRERARARMDAFTRFSVDAAGNDPLSTFEPQVSLGLGPNLSLVSSVQLSPSRRLESRELRDRKSLVDELYLEWKSGRVGMRVGRFAPTIGTLSLGSQVLSGVSFGFENPGSVSQRIGLGVSLELGNDRLGSHVLNSDLFTSAGLTDLSVGDLTAGLSDSHHRKAAGFTLVGQDIPVLPGLTYQIGVAYQGAARRTRADRAQSRDKTAVDESDDSEEEASSAEEEESFEEDDSEAEEADGAEEADLEAPDLLGESAFAEQFDAAFDRRMNGSSFESDRAERDYVGGLAYEFHPVDALGLNILTQYLYRDGSGTDGTRRSWVFGTAATLRENFQWDLFYTRRDSTGEERSPRDSVVRTSVGYFRDFREEGATTSWLGQLGFEVDLSRIREQDQRSNSAGFRLTWFSRF